MVSAKGVKRVVRLVLASIVSVAVLFVAMIYLMTRVTDPNNFKPRLRRQALVQANLDLRIPGKITWSFWPTLGLHVGRVEARIAGRNVVFAAVDSASIDVSTWALLLGSIKIDKIAIDGIDINLLDVSDVPNWERIGPQPGTARHGDGDRRLGLDPGLTIGSVVITNGYIRYQNASRTDIRISNFNLNAMNVNFSTPFPVTAGWRLSNQDNLQVHSYFQGMLQANPANGVYVLSPMRLDTAVWGIAPEPLKMHLEQTVRVDTDRKHIDLDNIRFHYRNLQVSGDLTLTDPGAGMTVQGDLHTKPFDMYKLLASLPGGAMRDLAGKLRLTNVVIGATFDSPEGTLVAKPLRLTSDQGMVDGAFGINDLDGGTLTCTLHTADPDMVGYFEGVDHCRIGEIPKQRGFSLSLRGK